MVVKVVLVVTVQGSGLPATIHDVALLKLDFFTSLLLVMILREEPAFVRKLGVTVKKIEESEFIMSSNLSGYDCEPCRFVRYVSGVTAAALLAVPNMIGLPRLASSSILTVMVKIAVVVI